MMAEPRVKVWIQRPKDRPALLLQWIDPTTGRRKSKSAETADAVEAEQRRADLEADLNHGRYAEASRMTWQRFRELFEDEYLPNLRPDTRAVHRNALNLFEAVCNPKAIRSVNERTISAFVAGLRKRPGRNKKDPMMASTIYTRLEFLHTALTWAKDQGLIPAVPKFPRVKVPKKKPQPVATESVERMLGKATDPELRAFLLCAWLAGLRRKEAMALEWEETDKAPWVDLDRNRIWLPAEFVKAVEDQWVPLDAELRKALLSLPRSVRRVFHFAAYGHRNEARPTTMSDRVAQLARRAGIRLSMKSLRRGFGCRYAGRVPAQVLQKLMRHANIKTTMDYYANVDDAVEAAVLGEQHNSLHNTAPQKRSVEEAVKDAKPRQGSDSGSSAD